MLGRLWASYRGAFGGLPRQMWFLALVTLVNRSGTMVLPFMTLYMTQDLGFDIAFAGFVLTLYGVGAVIGTYVGGVLTDRIGPFRVMFFSIGSAGLSFWGLEHLSGRWLLPAGMFVLGLVAESYRPASASALSSVCPPELRSRGFALDRLAINVGATLGPAVGGLLALTDFRWLFRIDGLTCLCASALILKVFPRDAGSSGEARRAVSSGGAPHRDPVFLLFLFLIFLSCLSFFQLFSTYPLYLKSHMGMSEFQYGLAMSFNGALIILFEMQLTHRLEARHPLRVVGWGALLVSMGLGLLPLGMGFGFVLFTVLVWTVGEMAMSPPTMSFVASRAPDHQRGRYMGMLSMAFACAHIVGPGMGGWIYETFGPNTLWYGLGLSGVVTLFAFEVMARKVRLSSD